MKTIVVVYGTRPEAIKLAPVVIALRSLPLTNVVVVSTGQHTDLLTQAEAALKLVPDIKLAIASPNQSLTETFAIAMSKFGAICATVRPDMVVVQGDTTTAAAAALTAFYQKIPVAHVEAGLRTHKKDSPFPEELNRILIDQVSSILFAPTSTSAEHLKREGLVSGVHIVGNTVVDAFNLINPLKTEVLDSVPPYLVFTMHRRESFGSPMRSVCKSLLKIVDCEGIDIVIPIHPNPEVQRVISEELGSHKHIKIVNPLGYTEFLQLVSGSRFVLSDSGGVQEEAALVHKPILILRDCTERPEVVQVGIGKLVGYVETEILAWTHKLLHDPVIYEAMCSAPNPFGDGTSSQQIAEVLQSFLERSSQLVQLKSVPPLPTT